MPLVGAWCKVWIYFGFVVGWSKGARPRFDTSTDMGLVLIPADAEVDSVIFRLRATDQDADFPLVFEVTATITPVVRIENLPCTLYNKVCQANVILTKRLTPGRLHDFAVRVRDTKGDSNSMQATISVTNASTSRDKIFPHIPSLVMVPEDTKPGKELDYLLVRANSWSGKPVYIELWQPKELFTIRQRQTPTQTRGIITLIGELDFETQSMYTLTMYATDPYTEPGKDTRNIAGLNVVVVVQDVQDVPPIFTLAPPLTKINNSVQPGDIILRVHAEDGDKGVPREITYGLVSEGNPFTPFFDISETTGEIMLAKSLEELTQITHVGAPVVLTVVAEEIRRSREEPPAQATVVDVGFLLGEPGNSPPYFESDSYITTIDENLEPGTVLMFSEPHSCRVRDEDIGKAGVFALKLEGNNGTFEINPTVAERTADFVITVRDNALIDYELYKTLSFKIVAQEVGPATNLSASVPVTIFLRDVNDNPPVFNEESYEVTLSENVTAGTRVVQVHATDKDTGLLGSVRYTGVSGQGSEAFTMDPDTGLITVAMGSSLDREIAPKLLLSVEARDEDGKGNRGVVPFIVHLIDVNDNAPLFEKSIYEFMLNAELTNFSTPAFLKAIDADAEPPNNEVRYELVHGNYENKFQLNEITGELTLRSPITRIRRKKQSVYESYVKKSKEFVRHPDIPRNSSAGTVTAVNSTLKEKDSNITEVLEVNGTISNRTRRASNDPLYTLTARAYDLGVPHLSSVTEIRVLSGAAMEARIMMFVVPGEHPDSTKTAETLAAITGGRVTVLETRPYVPPRNQTGGGGTTTGSSNKTIVVARVEQTDIGTALVDVEKIRDTLAASGVGIINGTETVTETPVPGGGDGKSNTGTVNQSTNITNATSIVTHVYNEEVVVYKAENKLLFWLLIILGLLMIAAITALIICCICPGCPFYMAPRKRRVHSSETLIVHSDGRPKRHLHRKPLAASDGTYNNGRKQAWSADPTRRNWQFNRRNIKNCGLASLPGDVAYISGQATDVHVNADSGRLRDAHLYGPPGRRRMGEQEGLYVEDVEAQKGRSYDAAEMDSLQRHEIERSSDAARHTYRQRYVDTEMNEEDHSVREQHFYREGNAEVLRLVTRGQMDEATGSHHHHYHRQPATLVIDGKDIILRRFMEDQKSRHDLSVHDMEGARSMDSHRRSQEVLHQQPEIILIPERLEVGRRQHVDELGPAVQRLVIDHGDYESHKIDGKDSLIKETPRRSERHESLGPAASSTTERASAMTKERSAPYSFHDMELAKQNVLLTRLLLERENRQVAAGAMDSTSYLETQSLPGQVAIATQTDRTTATQTERHVRSRSDNDESDEEAKHRKKLKPRKRYEDSDWKRTRALWMKSPIAEEEGPYFDKRLSILRKKVKEVKEGNKRTPLQADVLREISDSLNGNSSSNKADDDSRKTYQKSTEETSIRYKVLNDDETGSPSSAEICKTKRQRIYSETCIEASDDAKVNGSESTSSQDVKDRHEKRSPGKFGERSPRKEGKSKVSKKSDSIAKPSFRILEKEITMLTKKLSKLSDKKIDGASISDSASQERLESSPSEVRKESEQRLSRKADSRGQKDASSSKVMAEQGSINRKEAAIAKTRQKLKYQQTQVMSTGSSEYDDNFEKPKKQVFKMSEDVSKQKQAINHQKMKRQSHVERHEPKKQDSEDQEDAEFQKSGKESQKIESQVDKLDRHERHEKSKKHERMERFEKDEKTEKPDKSEKREKPEKPLRVSRPPKLSTITHTENIQELSASISSSDGSAKKAMHGVRQENSDKKSSTESSDSTSNDSDKQQTQKVSKGKLTQTTTETIESQSEILEKRETDLRKDSAIMKSESVRSDEKEKMKPKQRRKEISTEKMESEKKDISFDSSAKSDTHSQDSMRKKEDTEPVSELKKETHFFEKLPSTTRQYAEEITAAAVGIAGIQKGEKDNTEIEQSDSNQPETNIFRHKEEDKHGKETPTDTEAGAEGKLDENTKDSMLLKETEKQVEDTITDNAGKTEVTHTKEDKQETDSNATMYTDEGKLIETTPITDVKEELKKITDTVHEEIEEISGFTIHKIPKAHERIDKFEDNFSEMDVQPDTIDPIKQEVTQPVDKELSNDDKRASEETVVNSIEDETKKLDIEASKDIPQKIEIQSEGTADIIKQSTNGESKKTEHEEDKLQFIPVIIESNIDPQVTSEVVEEKTAESKEDEKQQAVTHLSEEDGKQDEPGTESAVVTEVGATVKMPKSGGQESEEEPSTSGAKDIEHQFQHPLTPDTNMIQTATGKEEEVKTSPEPSTELTTLKIVAPERKEEINKIQLSPEESVELESESLSKTVNNTEEMTRKLSSDISEEKEVVGPIEPETKELLTDDVNKQEDADSDINQVEKEDTIQTDLPVEQKEEISVVKSENVSELERDDEQEKFEDQEKKDTKNGDDLQEEKDKNVASGIIDDEKEQTDVADAIGSAVHEAEQQDQVDTIKSPKQEIKQQDEKIAVQNIEHEKDQKDEVGVIERTKPEMQQDEKIAMHNIEHEKDQKSEMGAIERTKPEMQQDEKIAMQNIEHEKDQKDEMGAIERITHEMEQNKEDVTESPKRETQQQENNASLSIEHKKELKDDAVVESINDESQQDKVSAVETMQDEKNEDENYATGSTEFKNKDKHEEDTEENADDEKKNETEKDITGTTEHHTKVEHKTDKMEITEKEKLGEEINKTEETVEISTKEIKQDIEDLASAPATLSDKNLIQMPEEKVADDDITQGEKIKEPHLLQQDLTISEIPIKEENEIKVGKDEPTNPVEDETPSTPTSAAEDRESVSSKLQEDKMEAALGSPVAEEVQKIGFPGGDHDVKHLGTSPSLEEDQPVALQTESVEKGIDIHDSDTIPKTKDSFLDSTDENIEGTSTLNTNLPLPEIPKEVNVPEPDQNIETKEEKDMLKESEAKSIPESSEAKTNSEGERGVQETDKSDEKIATVSKIETEEKVSSTKEGQIDSTSPEDSKETSTNLPDQLSEDKVQDSIESKPKEEPKAEPTEELKEEPKVESKGESSKQTQKTLMEALTYSDTDAKEEEGITTDSEQMDKAKLDEKHQSLKSSLEPSDISSGPGLLQVISDPLTPESELPTFDTTTTETEETTSVGMSDSTEASEPKGQLALPSEATAREATKDSAEERSFIILESEPHLAEVGRLNKEEDSGETLLDDSVKHEAQKITFPDGKNSPDETKDKISSGDVEETVAFTVLTEKIVADDAAAAEYADLDLPVFTSAIDTLDISDDSDSSVSSDISRKTTLTTGPYQTPRHRARSSSEKESTESDTKSPPDDSSDKEMMDITDSVDEHDTIRDSKLKSKSETTEDSDTSSSKLTEISVADEYPKIEEQGIRPVSEIPQKQEEPLPSTSSQMKGLEEFVNIQPILKFEKGITKSIKNGKGIKSLLEPKSRLGLKSKRISKKEPSPSSSKPDESVKIKEPANVISSTKKDRTSDQKKVSSIEKRQSFRHKLYKSITDQTKRKPADQEEHRTQDQNKSRDPSQEKPGEKVSDRSRRRHSDEEKQKQKEEQTRRYSYQVKTSRKSIEESRKSTENLVRKSSIPKSKPDTHKKSSSSDKLTNPPKPEIDLSKAQPKYMAWYKKNQEEMEKRRSELKVSSEEDEQLPKWLRRSIRRSKAAKDEKKKLDEKTPEVTPRAKRKVKPLVNVESEQLKAIVRQGRKLRRAEGGTNEDPPVQIFATSPPAAAPAPEPLRHHLVQHSEYKYEKIPPPFYLHPPPAPHPSPQLSPEHFDASLGGKCSHHQEDFDAGVAMPVQGTARLRHQQLLEKKSVFDIAYSEAAPSQLRPDSTTPPS